MGQIQGAATGVVSSVTKAIGTYKGVEAKKELIASNAAKNDLKMANTKSQIEHRDAQTNKIKQDTEMAAERQAQKIKESESRTALNEVKRQSLEQAAERSEKRESLMEEKTKAQTANLNANTQQRTLKVQLMQQEYNQRTMAMNKERIDLAEKRIMELREAQASINNHMMNTMAEHDRKMKEAHHDISALSEEQGRLWNVTGTMYRSLKKKEGDNGK